MIRLLDCTLRDGGYINDWNFGKNSIREIVGLLESSGVDILELGFIKDEPYNDDRTVFNDIDQISALIPNKKQNINYAAMVEVVNPIPLSKLKNRTDSSIDTIRVIVWKSKRDKNGTLVDALDEGFNYCKGIAEKGYNICVQPARVDQYSDSEFIAMINKFKVLNPMAVYVVDSWGTLCTEEIMHYVRLADKALPNDVAIGYHGHNNLMQAFGTASSFIHCGVNRDLIVDASVYGIGRGAGNLNVEIFSKYLNDTEDKKYNLQSFIELYEKFIKSIYKQHEWGYSIPYYLTAKYKCNPNYGEYYGLDKKIPSTDIDEILNTIRGEDKVIYSKSKADFYLDLYKRGKI